MKQPNNTKTKIYSTALYMRLSRDDENFGDSVSIETQRTILQKFAAENGLRVYGEYVDDGWSGTNFDRPSFQRMMNDVEAGKVNCIVTKDLSRFGREHVMMDYYLEFVFRSAISPLPRMRTPKRACLSLCRSRICSTSGSPRTPAAR